jgi:uncharacterized protein YbjQ (UPF0145 family)
MEELIIIAVALVVTYITGSVIEKNHYKSIKQREIALIRKPIVSYGIKEWDSKRKIRSVELVTGEVVVGVGYFKAFVANLKNLFGGRLTSIESVLDRGRREAILRMREKAIGANFIINTRIDTVMLNDLGGKSSDPQCAIIASGTAITYE